MKFTYTEKKDTRSGFGAGLAELADKNPNVVALCADLIGSLKMEKFIEKAPERFVQTGIAEANMMGIAAGLATAGKIPFAGTFANFATSRVLDQVRQSIAYSNKNVKIAASHAGLTLGEDGATHQVLEDIGQMKMLPGMVVINPCDYNQTKQATLAAAEYEGPVYLRFGRPVVPVFIPEDMPFEIGKGILLQEGKDVTIVATGHLVWESLLAAEELEKEGISCEVINIHTIKPLDEELLASMVEKTGFIVTMEENILSGGFGSAVLEYLSKSDTRGAAEVLNFGIPDEFVHQGSTNLLLRDLHLDAQSMAGSILAKLRSKVD